MTLKLNGTNSEAAPAYAGDDADTGLQCGTNELKLVTGGSARATVDSAGNVGIGVTAPDSRLEVKGYGNITGTPFEYIYSTDAGIKVKGNESAVDIVSTDAGNHAGSLIIRGVNKGYALHNDTSDDLFRLSSFTASADNWNIHETNGINVSSLVRLVSFRKSGGMCFGNDTAAANALDDYEEGTWTPTAAGGHTGISVDTANCVYVKVGRLVTLHFEIYYPTGISGSLFKIGGVPFQIDEESIGGVMLNSVDFPTNRTMVSLYGNNSELRLYGSGSGQSWGGLGGDDVTTDASILGTITYRST